jgi:hypothetical protein
MKYVILCVLLAGCASHAVRCDQHLLPINPPATKPADAPAQP